MRYFAFKLALGNCKHELSLEALSFLFIVELLFLFPPFWLEHCFWNSPESALARTLFTFFDLTVAFHVLHFCVVCFMSLIVFFFHLDLTDFCGFSFFLFGFACFSGLHVFIWIFIGF